MKLLFYIFFALIISTYSVLPSWNIANSAYDLLNGKDSYTYQIDHRNNWYAASDNFNKTITKNANGEITHKNKFTLYPLNYDENDKKFENEVEFEAIESFYRDTKSKTTTPLVCFRGNHGPYKVTDYTTLTEITPSDVNWRKTDKFDLKCYFHRSQGGHFLVYYLMNGVTYLLQLESSELKTINRYRFSNIDEIYDFKILNRPNFDDGSEKEYYPFMGLVKMGEYLRLIGLKFYFTKTDPNTQNIDSYKDLLKIKSHTQAYFHVFHFNNDFYYFTYNTIYDFVSGYSTKSIYVDWDEKEDPKYNEINDLTFVNNEVSPFEFEDEVEIIQMENIFNYRYA